MDLKAAICCEPKRGLSLGAELRESTILASMALCLHWRGIDARIYGAPRSLMDSERWGFFSRLWCEKPVPDRVGLLVQAAGNRKLHATPGTFRVCYVDGVKAADRLDVARSDMTFCRVYEPNVAGHPGLVPTPFHITDRHVPCFLRTGLYQPLLLGDCQPIREHFRITDERLDRGCFYGAAAFGRKAMATKFPKGLVDFETFEAQPPLSTPEYFNWLGRYKLGVCLPGDVEKTYRFTESIIAGCAPVVTEPKSLCYPIVDRKNAVIVRDWDDAERFSSGMTAWQVVRDNATEVFRSHWCINGWCNQILSRMGVA